MTPAFAPPSAFLKPTHVHSLINRRPHVNFQNHSRAARMTSAEIAQETPVEPTPPSPKHLPPSIPDPCPPFISALYDIISGQIPAEDALSSLLHPNCTWDMPVFTNSTRKEISSSMASFLSFAVDPTLRVYSISESTDTSYIFSWSLSWNYPLPWRPRVAISADTTVTLKGDMVEFIQDKWYASPMNIIAQTLPTIPDIIWLWPAPHAETDRGSRTTLYKTRQYTIIRQAPREEFRIQAPLKTEEQKLAWATPVLPDDAFVGNLRKLEFYSTVSPISLRTVDEDIYEWAINVPGAHVGSSDVRIEPPEAEDVEIVEVGERNFAVVRFRGYSTRDIVMEKLKVLRDNLVKDGILGAQEAEECIFWVRVYDAKVGFNSKGGLTMAMYGSSRGVPRVNELAIDVTGKDGIRKFL